MDDFIGAHYYPIPTQGNIYTTVSLALSSGKNSVLIATLKRKVFSCEFVEKDREIIPSCKEVSFTYIPSGAEIISIDAFNKSNTCDDFYVGITIIKVNSDQSTESYLNVYTEQDIEDRVGLNIENLAQNCIMLDLSFIPYQLYHTQLMDPVRPSEVVWLLSGSDLKVHLFREDPLNHTYREIEAVDLFPEFSKLSSIVLWMDIKYTTDKLGRLTAFGCECGMVEFYYVDILKSTILLNLSRQFDAPVTKVLLFQLNPNESTRNTCDDDADMKPSYHMLVINSLQPSVVFMDIIQNKFNNVKVLPESEKYDTALCASIVDINMDFFGEILVGTFAKELLVYRYEHETWKLQSHSRFPYPIHSIMYLDLTNDGVKELLIVTMLGILIYQHDLQVVMKKLKDRLLKHKEKPA